PPTISMTVSVNDSPLAGREGDKVQSRVIRDRLLKEAQSNVAIRVSETPDKDAYEVAGRGELQLGVLIESMRREGFEVSISRPRAVFQTNTRGYGMLNRAFSNDVTYKGAYEAGSKRVLVSNSEGETGAYALWNLQERGTMFVGGGEKTYQRMIICENSRQDYLDVNTM